MKYKYDIQSLIETFEDHEKRFVEDRKDMMKTFPNMNLSEDDFNISKAFAEMCKQIKAITESLRNFPSD